ncbi:EF-hand domain-containing protein [Coralloluteibacterium stylophorae]|uniref:EF-hand domain-containing protein n=1 Tax=Coralloluteibacterium stylophorae TaxID=1776034 RepID=A0A8J8AXE1_9GAMM|nr:EF-hand domain-containing protein [Coralloluteibacterium stylophorae]MBS7457097.1 EF-hand domain-containing protein [Coralloluteibacterium stylophorae]
MSKAPEAARRRRLAGPILLAAFAAAEAVAARAPQPLPRTPEDYLRRIDDDGDGRISREEYVAHSMRAFETMDRDGDGVLAGAELPFAESAPVSRERRTQALERVFDRLDSDRDGTLDARELASPLR